MSLTLSGEGNSKDPYECNVTDIIISLVSWIMLMPDFLIYLFYIARR